MSKYFLTKYNSGDEIKKRLRCGGHVARMGRGEVHTGL
jgi:hypothetical protein